MATGLHNLSFFFSLYRRSIIRITINQYFNIRIILYSSNGLLKCLVATVVGHNRSVMGTIRNLFTMVTMNLVILSIGLLLNAK